jgi:hypothetical protein
VPVEQARSSLLRQPKQHVRLRRFDGQETVVLDHPLAPRWCARLDLPATGGDGKIGDEGVCRLT